MAETSPLLDLHVVHVKPRISTSPSPAPSRRALITPLVLVALVLPLTGCLDRPWTDDAAERIDAAVAGVDFSSVGGIDCDHRRPGNWLAGNANTRTLGVGGAENGPAVVELLGAAGFTTGVYDDDLSDGYITLRNDSETVQFSLAVVREAGRSYADGHCTSPEGGVVRIRVSG